MASFQPTKKQGLLLVAVLLLGLFAERCGCLLVLQAALASVRNEPSAVVVDADRYDFGSVTRGPALEARFRVTNVGGRRLIMHREKDSCPCFTSEPEIYLPPGASCDLTATLRTKEFQGAVQSQIRYRTNDPRRPVLELTLLADVSAK